MIAGLKLDSPAGAIRAGLFVEAENDARPQVQDLRSRVLFVSLAPGSARGYAPWGRGLRGRAVVTRRRSKKKAPVSGALVDRGEDWPRVCARDQPNATPTVLIIMTPAISTASNTAIMAMMNTTIVSTPIMAVITTVIVLG